MTLPPLDLSGTKGVGRRKLDAVPQAFRLAFDPASEADDVARGRACDQIREVVSGEEGAFTTAGARVLAAAIDALLGADVACADRLAELALDLAYGDQPVALAPVPPAAIRSVAAKAVRAVVTDRLAMLRAGLRASIAEARGLSAWLLLSADAVDEAVLEALATERDAAARAALVGALAGMPTVDRALLRASMSPPSPPSEQAAAAAAWWTLDGDAAPDAVARVLLASRHHERPGAGFPWRAAAGRLGFRRILSTDSTARVLVCDWLLRELVPALTDPHRDKAAAERAFADLTQVLHALLPRPLLPAAALSELARRAVEATTSRWFLGRRDFAALGLPETVAERRAWLGMPSAHDPADPMAPVARWAATIEGIEAGGAPSAEEARAALLANPPAARLAWANHYLARRRAWPGATRAPNRLPTLLALEQLDPRAIDALWCRSHEPVLAALSVEGEGPVALLGRIPVARRPHVWRAWIAVHPNPDVAFREGVRFAPACPTQDVAFGLVGLAAVVTKDEVLAPLAAVFDAMGEAGVAARSRLAMLAKTAGA